MMKSPMPDGKQKQRRARPKLNKQPNNYFVDDEKDLQFISTGCTVLNCALGGGYPLGRIVNLVGDRSTAKTGLAQEAVTNFFIQYPNGAVTFCETEAAFDRAYAKAMGMPVEKVDFAEDRDISTIEAFAADLNRFVDRCAENNEPGLYVLDSLDALSDEAEMAGKAAYGTAKAKGISVLFRKRLAKKIRNANVCLIIISQVREKIGVVFGEKYTRSGGKALDHYASQIIWLAHTKTVKRIINKIERATGITIKASIRKNKAGIALRDCTFNFTFAFGVDDLNAGVSYLKEHSRLGDLKFTEKEASRYLRSIDDMNTDEYKKERAVVAEVVRTAWREIETSFLPKRSKYA